MTPASPEFDSGDGHHVERRRPRRRPWSRRRLLTLAYALVVLGMVLGFLRVQSLIDDSEADRERLEQTIERVDAQAKAQADDRAERVQQNDALSCALARYFRNVRQVVSRRGLPGDDEIVTATVAVIAAAVELAPECPPEPPEERP